VTPLVDGSQVTFIANYLEKKTGNDLMAEYNCTYLVNGGFYTKEQTPVGYVKTEKGVLSKVRESQLFDGFISINEMQTPRITRTLPIDTLISALQTGPILIENGSPITLKIQNDKQARRMFALVDGNNKLLFGMVTSSTLADLPKIVFEWAKTQKIAVADAINLDGGSASTYRGPNGIYPEISPIGSAFCIKE
jgi:exopolysaccharide biosynthesis protein